MDGVSRVGVRAISALLPDLSQQPGPRYRALSTAVAGLLLDGRLAPGIRLPSERELAVALRISRSTATAAYEQLARDGLLARRRGSGSYLVLPTGSRVSFPGGRLNRQDGDPAMLDLSIAALPAVPGAVELAAGRALQQLGRHTAAIGYQPYGLAELRERIAARYRQRGVPTEPEQILITNGAQHGLDLLFRLILSAGDRVVTELPTYPGALDAIRAHSGRVVAVPFGPDGRWDADALRNTLLQTAAKLAFVIPDFHNPTGVLIGTGQREQLLAAARRAGTSVIVDESFVELNLSEPGPAHEPAAPMAALDPSVFSVGSLSKPIWGGLRIGWIRSDADTVSRLAIVRARTDMSGSLLDQLVAVELFDDLDEIVGRRRAELRIKRDTLRAALAERLPAWRPSRSAGGVSTWVELDAPAATALTQLAEQRAVLLTPGSRFAVDGTLERYLRLPYALPPAQLIEAVSRIAQAWDELDGRWLGRPRPSSLVTA